jgi:hypothetical protein
MDVFAQAAEKIIKEQQNIIGPLALEQAKKVAGLKLSGTEVTIEGDKTAVLEKLVEQYQALFGQTSVEVCKDAVKSVMGQLPADQVPALLK